MRARDRAFFEVRAGGAELARDGRVSTDSGQPLVMIVSSNLETLDGLEAYFRSAGVPARVSQRLGGAALERQDLGAVVIFPDDYGVAEVEAEVLRLVKAGVSPVLVTREPRRFESLLRTSGASALTILPKPAWGWIILESVRAALEGPLHVIEG